MPTSITLYGGVAEIGGNKILIETAPEPFQSLGMLTDEPEAVRPTRLMLDFGLSFGNEKMFYSGFLQPRRLSGIALWRPYNNEHQISELYKTTSTAAFVAVGDTTAWYKFG